MPPEFPEPLAPVSGSVRATGVSHSARTTALGFLGFGLALLALFVFSPWIGTVPIPAGAVASIVLHEATGGALPADACGGFVPNASRCAVFAEIVWQARVPELLLAMIVGAALGLSGATLQGVFRNPLADPYLLGLSSGAALGAAALFVLGVGQADANLALPLFAFAGAILTGGAVLLAARSARASAVTLLLTGVVLSYLIAAILSVLLLVNPLGDLQVTFWLLGGLSGATWNRDGIVFGGVLVAGALLQLYGRELNVLQLGADVAQTVGVDVRAARVRLVFLASLATAAAVAFAGIIGFVGLVSPHIVRRLLGPNYRIVIPGAALVGAVFLAAAHDLSQVIVPATELPVGIPTAFAGVPFFLYLLLRGGRSTAAYGGPDR